MREPVSDFLLFPNGVYGEVMCSWQVEKTFGSLRRRKGGQDDFFASVSLSYDLGADSAGNPSSRLQ